MGVRGGLAGWVEGVAKVLLRVIVVFKIGLRVGETSWVFKIEFEIRDSSVETTSDETKRPQPQPASNCRIISCIEDGVVCGLLNEI